MSGLSSIIDIQSLYDEVFPRVKDYVLRNSGTLDDAKDVFQEALSVLWIRSSNDGNGIRSINLGGFVYQVAKNKWLDQVRSARHKTRATLADEQGVQEEDLKEIEERIQVLHELYGRLDGKCKEVLDMFYYEKQDLKSIAEKIGVEVSSVRTIKYRCMMKLRQYNNESKGRE